VATETAVGGAKYHFYVLPTKAGGYALYWREKPGAPLNQRGPRLSSYNAVLGVLKTTLEAGEKQGSKHVWHATQYEKKTGDALTEPDKETLFALKPKRMYHGTPMGGKIQEEGFKPDKLDPYSLYGPGFYTDSPKVAGGYAEISAAVSLPRT
jgi:hypothetical protein